MSKGKRSLAVILILGVASVLGGCYGASTATYVGVSGPGPWYGYPYPGRYPGAPAGGGGWVGVTVCCEEEEQQQQEEEQQQQGMSLPVPAAPSSAAGSAEADQHVQ